jgi:hypothetical protein
MKKQTLNTVLDHDYVNTLDGLNLRAAAALLNDLAEAYEAQEYNNIRFSIDYEYYPTHSQYILTIVGDRQETDAEAKLREEREAKKIQDQRERDLHTLKHAAQRLGVDLENIKGL